MSHFDQERPFQHPAVSAALSARNAISAEMAVAGRAGHDPFDRFWQEAQSAPHSVGHAAWVLASDAYAQMREDLDDYPVLDDDHWSTLEYEEACDYWDSLSMRERIELCAHHRVSIFAARRDELPETPTGELCTYN